MFLIILPKQFNNFVKLEGHKQNAILTVKLFLILSNGINFTIDFLISEVVIAGHKRRDIKDKESHTFLNRLSLTVGIVSSFPEYSTYTFLSFRYSSIPYLLPSPPCPVSLKPV